MPTDESFFTVFSVETNETTARIIWSAVLAIAGLLDIFATVLPSMFKDDICSEVTLNACISIHASTSSDFIGWLERNHVGISFFFSTLWFVDAFRKAHAAEQNASTVLEHDRLTKGSVGSVIWSNLSTAYYKSVVWQLLLLPMGFYIATYIFLQRIGSTQIFMDFDQVVEEEVIVKEAGVAGIEDDDEVFSVRSKQSFLFVLAHYVVGETGRSAIDLARLKLKKSLHMFGRK